MKELFQQLKEILQKGADAVLVTVVASSGSVPRGAGARMLVAEEGRVQGTIGGGAVEYACEQRALEALKKRTSHIETFFLHENQIQDLGMICGGEVSVSFQYLSSADMQIREIVEKIADVYRNGEESWLVQDITEDAEGMMALFGKDGSRICGDAFSQEESALLLSVISGRSVSQQFTMEGHRYYSERLIQPGHVYIFGGGHVAQALVPALAAVDFRCIVLENREEFCRAELFPGAEEVRLIDMECPEVYAEIRSEDAVCIMTRGHKEDLTVQAQVLRTQASYIGVIGSRRKKEGVFARLREQGFTEEDLKRIKTPIGLEIKAETPAEIAVSITAELILHRAEERK